MTEPTWLTYARSELGTAEIPGPQTSAKIRSWLIALKAWWTDDETPWCGVFIANVMQRSGLALPKHWYRAKAWLEWGEALDEPCLGCVVVFERQGGGHVGLAVGEDLTGRLLVLGGNQGNRVSVAPFDTARVVGYRWPSVGGRKQRLMIYPNSEAASRNEA